MLLPFSVGEIDWGRDFVLFEELHRPSGALADLADWDPTRGELFNEVVDSEFPMPRRVWISERKFKSLKNIRTFEWKFEYPKNQHFLRSFHENPISTMGEFMNIHEFKARDKKWCCMRLEIIILKIRERDFLRKSCCKF